MCLSASGWGIAYSTSQCSAQCSLHGVIPSDTTPRFIILEFLAGFGKDATGIPFWKNVYGFNKSSIGKELVEDVVDGNNLVTKTSLLQVFDLVTMKPEEVDFTTSVQLDLNSSNSTVVESTITKCYEVVKWFEI